MVNDDDKKLRLYFKNKKGLSRYEFEEFLASARKIAVFNPDDKTWVAVPQKINELNRSELEATLHVLRRFSTLNEDQVREILLIHTSQREHVGSKDSLILTEFLQIRGSKEVLDKIIRDEKLSEFLEIKYGRIYLKSLVNLSVFTELLHKEHGIRLEHDPDLMTVKVSRKDAVLQIQFKVVDRTLSKILLDEGVLTYNIEKPILGPNNEYQGSELVTRTFRVSKWNWIEKTLVAPIALIDKYIAKLQSLGFKVETLIEEKPSFSLTLNKAFSLLPHQQEALELWMRRKRGTIAIFTRGGKSFIALEAIYRLRKPTLILVTTQELMTTWLDYLEKYLGLPRRFVGILGAGEQKIREITIATYTSAVKYIDHIKDKFELAIFDEAHHVPATTFKNVALRLDSLYRLALSATPTRRDNNHNLLYELCGELLYTLSYEDLVRLKVVAPIEEYRSYFVQSEEEKLAKLVEILNTYPSAKTLVFTQYLKTAEKIYSSLRERGYKVVMITGETPTAKRELVFKDFLEGRANIIVSTTVLDEGITVPDAEIAVIFEGSGEVRQMIQRIGRVLGYQPGKTSKVFEIVNISDPHEKYAYIRRSWVRELYLFKGLDKYVRAVKNGKIDEIKSSYQRRLDTF
ncbi:DEAD/DEAH box helicase [Infirmifilum uzonense]|uniref:DEAD/DEAH box helicase n=1 Tax=Infirmifilum uzonense TaxID=1550241 RepID=UPI00069B98A8|nr:DEAD/DEAH box helicase [Infirmifilum uzonense]